MRGRCEISRIGTSRNRSTRRNTLSVYQTLVSTLDCLFLPVINRQIRSWRVVSADRTAADMLPLTLPDHSLQPIKRLERLARRQLVRLDIAERRFRGGHLRRRRGRAARQAEERQVLGEARQGARLLALLQ